MMGYRFNNLRWGGDMSGSHPNDALRERVAGTFGLPTGVTQDNQPLWTAAEQGVTLHFYNGEDVPVVSGGAFTRTAEGVDVTFPTLATQQTVHL